MLKTKTVMALCHFVYVMMVNSTAESYQFLSPPQGDRRKSLEGMMGWVRVKVSHERKISLIFFHIIYLLFSMNL